MLNLAYLNLKIGHSVILDAPWTHLMLKDSAWGRKINELATLHSSKLVVLECILPADILRSRIQSRGLRRDSEKLTDAGWPEFLERNRVGELIPLPRVILEMRQRPNRILVEARQAVVGNS